MSEGQESEEKKQAQKKIKPGQINRELVELSKVQDTLTALIQSKKRQGDIEYEREKEENRSAIEGFYGKRVTEILGENIKLEEYEGPDLIDLSSKDKIRGDLREQAAASVFADNQRMKYEQVRLEQSNVVKGQELKALGDTSLTVSEGVSAGILQYSEYHGVILQKARNLSLQIRNLGIIIAVLIGVLGIYEYDNNPQTKNSLNQFLASPVNDIMFLGFFVLLFYVWIRYGSKKKA